MRKLIILALIATALGQVPTTNPANTAFKPTPANPYYPALAGLRLIIGAGSFINPTTNATITLSQQTIFLPDNSSNFVYLLPASGIIANNTTGFPTNSYPIATVTTAGGQMGALKDVRADVQNVQYVVAGTLPSTTLTGVVPVSTGGGISYGLLTSSSMPEAFFGWGPGAVSANSCVTNTFPMRSARISNISTTQVIPGDFIAPAWPINLPANLVGMMRVSASDVIEIRLCNPTGSPTSNPGVTLIFGAKLIR